MGGSGGTDFCFRLASSAFRVKAQEKAIRQTIQTMKSFLNISTTFDSTLVSIKGSVLFLKGSILATHRRQNWEKSPIFQEFWGEWEECWIKSGIDRKSLFHGSGMGIF